MTTGRNEPLTTRPAPSSRQSLYPNEALPTIWIATRKQARVSISKSVALLFLLPRALQLFTELSQKTHLLPNPCPRTLPGPNPSFGLLWLAAAIALRAKSLAI